MDGRWRPVQLMASISENGWCVTVSCSIGRNTPEDDTTLRNVRPIVPDWACGRAALPYLGYIERAFSQVVDQPVVLTTRMHILDSYSRHQNMSVPHKVKVTGELASTGVSKLTTAAQPCSKE